MPDDIAQASGSRSRVKPMYVDELSYLIEVARGERRRTCRMCRKAVQLRAVLFL